jgi:hypothetical protein
MKSATNAARRAAASARQLFLAAGLSQEEARKAASEVARSAYQAFTLAEAVKDAVDAVERRQAPAGVAIRDEQALAEHRDRIARKAKMARGMALTARS